MSLVDYASSDEEEDAAEEAVAAEPPRLPDCLSPPPQHRAASPVIGSRASMSSSYDKIENSSQLASPPFEKLPDASVLLNLPISSHPINSTDHSSRVAAAFSQKVLHKREGNGSISSYTRTKVPRGSLPHSKNIPDTGGGGQLVPPQLSGRSNVVTEDIGKLFVRRTAEGSHTRGS
ncbi:hypothetical protein Dimus_018351 [Dionaea muscipula]